MHFMNSSNSQRPYKLELCLLAIITVVIQDMYFLVNGLNENAHYLHTTLDHVIPLIKWFAIPYIWYYFYLVGVLIWFAFRNTTAYYQLLFARIAGIVVCFIVYVVFPTATIRPEIVGNDILSKLVRTIYTVDKDYNCLPSTHCLDTLITSLFLLKYERGWMLRGLSVVSLVLIYLSTVFLKQHVLVDLVASTALGIILYAIFQKQSFAAFRATLRVFYREEKHRR